MSTVITDRPVRALKSSDMKNLSPIEQSAAKIAEAQAVIDSEIAKRDKYIAAARRDGYPWNKIGEAARLSRQAVEAAARRGNKGELPRPRQQD